MNHFLSELKRRKVFHTAAAYGVVAAGVWGAAADAFSALGLLDAAVTFVVVATLVGFPVALVMAWFFEVRVEGTRAGVDAPYDDARGSSSYTGAAGRPPDQPATDPIPVCRSLCQLSRTGRNSAEQARTRDLRKTQRSSTL